MQEEIIELLFDRNEKALELLERDYKNYCLSIAQKILGNREDAEEIWNDVLSKTWNAVPPAKPKNIKLWLARIARNAALTMLEAKKAEKRSGIVLQLEELSECIPAPLSEKETDVAAFREFMKNFIKKLSSEQRRIFIKRYWYCESIGEIAKSICCSENKVSLVLFRIRKRLKKELEKEGFDL